MAIKILKFKKNELIEGGEINFTNSNIVSIVGMNGSGKTILMKHIDENFDSECVEQIVHKKDIETVEEELNNIFNVGKHQKEFKKFIEIIKDDSMQKENEVKKKLDNFIWNRFKSSYKSAIENNFLNIEIKEIWKKYDEIQVKNYFNSEIIKQELPQILDFVRIEQFQKLTDKLNKMWIKLFKKPKLITVDINKFISLQDIIYDNGIGDFTLAECLRRDQELFYRLLMIAGINNKRYAEIVNKNSGISNKEKEKINNWFKSYVSQDLKIILDINNSEYLINFFEKETEVDFKNLSTGTQNLLKIISQINIINSKTIIQIDEPETGMHPMMQIQFRDFLEGLSTKTQGRFIIYTHSNFIVKDGSNTLGLYIMVRNNNMSKLYSQKEYVEKTNILDIQIFENLGYESLKYNYNLNRKNIIIIVEGETDVIYLKKMMFFLKKDVNIVPTKIGGATNILKTCTLLEAVHDFKKSQIVLSPDKDIEEKFPKIYKQIKNNENYIPLGTNERPEIEGFFVNEDKKYVVNSYANKNKKMNKANLFWRESNLNLNKETIKNFKDYFTEINKIQKKWEKE